MNALCWNCRGTSSKGFSKLMNDIMHEFHVSLCFLLETHASVSNTEKIIKRMRFDSHYIVGSKGQAGGFGILGILQWKIRVVEVDDQFVHFCSLTIYKEMDWGTWLFSESFFYGNELNCFKIYRTHKF